MRLLFNLFEKKFINYLVEKQGTKLDMKNLRYEFADLDGKTYYGFPKEVILPIGRIAKLQEYVMWLQKGINSDEYDQMLEAADIALTDGLTNKKGGSKIGFIISELKDRKNMVVHEELFYNFIAVQLIRSDESITEFNNDIQMQKVDAIRKLNQKDDSFFLTIQKYLEVLNLSNITKEELMQLLDESITRVVATKKLLQNLSGKQ